MAKTLTDAQVVQFREQGWLAPMRAMDSEQAADCAARIAAYEAKMGESANRSLKIKGHLAMPWVVELGRNPAILDAVEDLMGPDIMLFGASIFAKGRKDRAYWRMRRPTLTTTCWRADNRCGSPTRAAL
jgi:hypothetical protein